MILAAGLGTRLKDETASRPKALVEVGGKTLLEHALEKLKNEGFTEVVVNVHHFAPLVIRFLASRDFGIPVNVSDESGKLLDTGGALKKAAGYFPGNDPVLIYNVDVLSDLNLSTLVDAHLRSGALATLVVRNRKTSRYLCFNQEKRLVGWMNKKTGERKVAVPEDFDQSVKRAFSGIHVIHPGIFEYMPGDDRFSIIDLYLGLAGDHLINGYFDESDWWIDVGKTDELSRARQYFRP
jgi:NDP-sugar pyrophosphorylase family protein